MNKKYKILILILFIGVVSFSLYQTFQIMKPLVTKPAACTYYGVPKNGDNGFVVQGKADHYVPETGKTYGCGVPVTICEGFNCVAPVTSIECNKSEVICGDVINCICESPSFDCSKVRNIATVEDASAIDKSVCEQCAGQIELGLPEWPYICNFYTSDAEKICTDSSQCDGMCIGESELSNEGKCSVKKFTFGCNIEILKGQAQSQLCID